MDYKEVDIEAIFRFLLTKKRVIIIAVVSGFILGCIYTLLIPVEYSSKILVVPETNNSKSGSLGTVGSLANAAGINLSGVSNEGSIPPELYPKIVNSVAFGLEAIQAEITVPGREEKATFYNYFKEIYKPRGMEVVKKYTLGLPGLIMNQGGSGEGSTIVRNDTTITELVMQEVSQSELGVLMLLRSRVSISVDERDGTVSIFSMMPNALQSAELAKTVLLLLEEKVMEIKTKKAQEKLDFINERYEEKKQDFEERQRALALFLDRNFDLASAIAKIELSRLQSEYDLAQSVLIELSRQLEAQLIEVKEETPLFTIIEPPMIPVKRAKPQRIKTTITVTMLFFFLAVVYLIAYQVYFVKPNNNP